MELNAAMIAKLANLAKLEFNEQELKAIQQDLEQMIGFVGKLNEIDTTGIAPLTHIGANANRLRDDAVQGSIDKDTALKNAPASTGDFFTVPKVIKK